MVKIIPIELKSFEHGLGAFCVEQGGKERWGVIDTDSKRGEWHYVNSRNERVLL